MAVRSGAEDAREPAPARRETGRAAEGPRGEQPPQIEGDYALAEAFARLGEGDREVLRLVAWEQLSLREAARVLGCSDVACRVRFHRARRRLAAHLKTLDETSTATTPRRHAEGATQ